MAFGSGRMNAAMHLVLAAFFAGGIRPGAMAAQAAQFRTRDRFAYLGRSRGGPGTAADKRAARKRRNIKRFRAQSRG